VVGVLFIMHFYTMNILQEETMVVRVLFIMHFTQRTFYRRRR